MSGPTILFVVNAGADVGGGHVMRSLTLAQALQAQGASCRFVGPGPVGVLIKAFAPDMDHVTTDDLAATVAGETFEAMVFDHYGLAEPEHRQMAAGRPVLVVDDLADRALGADLVLDAGPARKAEDYLRFTPAETRLLLGPNFAAVRPEFAALRAPALAWRGEPVQRVLVSLGLTDVDGITARIVERLRPRIHDIGIDIVLGAEAASLSSLTRVARHDPRLTVHVDTPHMARLTAEADLGVGAPGSSAWERCVLGLPSILVILAANQRPAAQALEAQGAALVVDLLASDFEASFDRALMKLLRDGEARRTMAARSAEVCDGLGAGRTAEAFLRLIASRA